jgi:hypothetical protein
LVLEPGKSSTDQQRIVRLIHVGGVPFSRILRIGAAGQRLQVPAGTAVAMELDSYGDVSRLAVESVAARQTREMRVVAPTHDAALVALFTIPKVVTTVDSQPAFHLDGERSADLVVDRGNELILVWPALEAGPNELTLRSATYQFPPAALRLRERSVTTLRDELRPLPSLSVGIDVPEDARAAWRALEPSLIVRRTADKKMIRQSSDASTDQVFALLPADTYDAVLIAKPWTFVRRADLTGGEDGAVDFSPEPIIISGRVTSGNEPKAASVLFRRGNGDSTTVKSGLNGEYEVTLWMSDMYIVDVVLDDDAAQPPFSRATRLMSTRKLDIHVPATRVLVQVKDAVTSKPVADADVTTFNRWESAESGKGTASHNVKSDANGIAPLAPLSTGTAEIHVRAAGYFKDDPIIIQVRDDEPERTVTVKVRPVGASSVIRITLPSGSPAEGAEVLAVGDLAGRRVLWSGLTDAQGRVDVPLSLSESILLVRHPAAAGLARRFRDLPDQEYRLPPASSVPLLIKVERRGEGSGNVTMTVWFGGLPLTGSALEFLARSPAYVSGAGLWKGMNLPREPLRVLASDGRIDAQIAAGAYDVLATVIPAPWPAQVTLTVVD